MAQIQNFPPGPVLPLGQLGHCLRPLSGSEAQNFEKEEVVEIIYIYIYIVLDETPKNLIHHCDQRTKNLEYPCKHWYPNILWSKQNQLSQKYHP